MRRRWDHGFEETDGFWIAVRNVDGWRVETLLISGGEILTDLAVWA